MTRSVAVRSVLVAALVMALAGLGARSARAGDFLACSGMTEKPFAQWSDGRSYRLAPGGDFENGAQGWTLTGGAKVVPGNESFLVRGSGSYSLYLPPGSSATSPAACVGVNDPTIRFFVQETGASSGTLQVDTYYRTALGLLPIASKLGAESGSAEWAPSTSYTNLGSVVGSLQADLTADIRFRFTPRSTSFLAPASYRIDEVFIDPYGLGNWGD